MYSLTGCCLEVLFIDYVYSERQLSLCMLSYLHCISFANRIQVTQIMFNHFTTNDFMFAQVLRVQSKFMCILFISSLNYSNIWLFGDLILRRRAQCFNKLNLTI